MSVFQSAEILKQTETDPSEKVSGITTYTSIQNTEGNISVCSALGVESDFLFPAGFIGV